jgi:hypothetical protein
VGGGGGSRGYEGENKNLSSPARESSPSARPTYQVCMYVERQTDREREREIERERERELTLCTPDVSGTVTQILKKCSV